MRPLLSAVVSYDDLKSYFSGESWEYSDDEEGKVHAKSDAYDVSIVRKGIKYSVSIASTDDPSDADKTVTDNPTDFIAKFLSTGTEADDFLKKMSFHGGPRLLAGLLSRVANLVESDVITMRQAAATVRRGIVMADGHRIRDFLAGISIAAIPGHNVRGMKLTKLRKEMEAKGWKVSQADGEDGMPTLTVDVSGIYEAKIRVDSIMYDCTFMVHDISGSEETVTTDDPIQAFRVYYKKDSTQEFKSELRNKRKSEKEASPEEGTKPAAPTGRKKVEERKESGKTREQEREETGDTLFAPTNLPPSTGKVPQF